MRDQLSGVEILSNLSQFGLLLVALGAAWFAWVQVGLFRRQNDMAFTAMLWEILEADKVRDARHAIMNQIEDFESADWWSNLDDNRDVMIAAARVCAAYDNIGSILTFFKLENEMIGRIFLERWGETAIRAHDEKLQGYLRFRRERSPKAYAGFTRFVDIARKRHPQLPVKTPPNLERSSAGVAK